MDVPCNNWGESVRSLRSRLNLSQEKLASLLNTNQCTISRWERGVTVPTYRMRARLKELGCESPGGSSNNHSAIAAFSQALFDSTSGPSMLLDKECTVVAMSSGHEYQPGHGYVTGKTLLEQSLPEDRDMVMELMRFFDDSGFWNTVNTCFEYPYVNQGEKRCVILTSVEFNGQTFCLMRRKQDTLSPVQVADSRNIRGRQAD
ncbi:helix-turn-helix domain-containing protein [Thiolapillus sp.]